MTSIGNNMKWTVSQAFQSGVRAFFEEGLQAKRVKDTPELDAFTLAGGKQTIGVVYVEPAKALSLEQAFTAPWLEFLTADVEAAVARLDKLGLERIDYFDQAHVYFRAPGGVVFRLASSTT